MSRGKSIAALIVCLAIVGLTAWSGSNSKPGLWYAQLAKPVFTPPGAVFGPVWSLLYLMMAIAAWLVWKKKGFSQAVLPLTLFLLQLTANAAWSWMFFGLHMIGLSVIVIITLWLLILATLVAFWNYHRPAGIMLLPYLAWVSFAVILNFEIWRLNS